ncbi:hypothetical protein JCM33374_g853 [Metschnikowia sp. JCM 33374]|nr:hypothetical protein JCM33374_g853 [Metschnikowia sp. JCM 33374]
MLHQIVRDSFFGRVVYRLSGRTLLKHKEELSSYVIPCKYILGEDKTIDNANVVSVTSSSSNTACSGEHPEVSISQEKIDADWILVTWDGEDDPENPYNWPILYKAIFIAKISLLTTLVYMASSIYTPGVDLVMQNMHVSRVKATLPLSMFVFGYGFGPMLLSPLSEDARIGRTSIYSVSTLIFFLLQIPTALVSDIASLSVLRFLSGVFGSPCLATGSASVGDITSVPWMPLSLAIWSAAQVSAPSFGPIIGAGLISDSHSYHWPFWFVCIVSGVLFIVLSVFLPESSGTTLLYRKAERLRALTGNDRIVSAGHLGLKGMNMKEILADTFWRPFEIMIFEPVVLLINIYLGLIYAILYLWFEAFPIVFYETYHFSLVGMGASYMSQIVGLLVGACFYLPITYHRFTKKLLAGQALAPEVHLPVCIFGSLAMSLGMIVFAWTSTPSIHWIVPMIGGSAFMFGAFFAYQTLFNYLGMSFYRFLASVFAGNMLFRAIMGGAFPLFGRSLFVNLATEKYPVAWGTMILAIALVILLVIPIVFYVNGPKLRARSKYAN